MNKKRALLLVLFLIFIPGLNYAAFEQIGAGARPIGMASAFSAISDDAHAIHYNPAGLAQVRRSEITAGYGKLYMGLKDRSNLGSGFVGAVQSLKQGRWGTLGMGWLSLSLESAYREDMIGLSYGKESFVNGLFFGGSAKVLKRSFGSDAYTQIDPLFTQNGQATTSISFDLGILYRPSASFSYGLAVKDVNQPNVGLSSEDKVPAELRAGFGYHQRQLLFAADISKKQSDLFVSIGLEKWLFKYLGLRAGLGTGSKSRRELATGLAYRGEHFVIDYAFVFPLAGIESTAGSHRFGVTAKFGKAPERAQWEFEEEDKMLERMLEEKSVQITSMEKELENLRELNRTGKLESRWVREQIQKLEEKLKDQESKDLETMKTRMFESRLEAEKLKKRIQEMEDKIRRMTIPRTVPASEGTGITTPSILEAPAIPRTYIVKEGETLQTIAEKFFGDSGKWVEIYELNSDRLERGGTIRAGQVLLLPRK